MFFSSSIMAFFLLAFSCLNATLSIASISFDDSMSRSVFYDAASSSKLDPAWSRFQSLYQAYQEKPVPTEDSPYSIPPIVHLIWLGSPLPERCKEMVDSWKKFHPSWEVKVWVDADVKDFQMVNQAAFDKATNYGEKADIWRYEILYRQGGLYVDTDFECLGPFDGLHRSLEFFAGAAYDKEALLYNGLIGTAPNHPILKYCIDSIKPSSGDGNAVRIMDQTGPYLLTRAFKEITSTSSDCSGKVVPFPVSFFYPFPNTDVSMRAKAHDLIKQQWAAPESLGLHYWAVSWQ